MGPALLSLPCRAAQRLQPLHTPPCNRATAAPNKPTATHDYTSIKMPGQFWQWRARATAIRLQVARFSMAPLFSRGPASQGRHRRSIRHDVSQSGRQRSSRKDKPGANAGPLSAPTLFPTSRVPAGNLALSDSAPGFFRLIRTLAGWLTSSVPLHEAWLARAEVHRCSKLTALK